MADIYSFFDGSRLLLREFGPRPLQAEGGGVRGGGGSKFRVEGALFLAMWEGEGRADGPGGHLEMS